VSDLKFYTGMLRSEECLCGRGKKPNNTFCYRCYSKLPADMQRDLYLRMGDGYEAAVDAACGHLQTEVW
jgi:hypothetical protein